MTLNTIYFRKLHNVQLLQKKTYLAKLQFKRMYFHLNKTFKAKEYNKKMLINNIIMIFNITKNKLINNKIEIKIYNKIETI